MPRAAGASVATRRGPSHVMDEPAGSAQAADLQRLAAQRTHQAMANGGGRLCTGSARMVPWRPPWCHTLVQLLLVRRLRSLADDAGAAPCEAALTTSSIYHWRALWQRSIPATPHLEQWLVELARRSSCAACAPRFGALRSTSQGAMPPGEGCVLCAAAAARAAPGSSRRPRFGLLGGSGLPRAAASRHSRPEVGIIGGASAAALVRSATSAAESPGGGLPRLVAACPWPAPSRPHSWAVAIEARASKQVLLLLALRQRPRTEQGATATSPPAARGAAHAAQSLRSSRASAGSGAAPARRRPPRQLPALSRDQGYSMPAAALRLDDTATSSGGAEVSPPMKMTARSEGTTPCMGRMDTHFGSGYDIGAASLIDGKLALEFGELFGDEALRRASLADASTAPDAPQTQKSSYVMKKLSRKRGEPGYWQERAHLAMYRLVQHRVFTSVFLLLTFFALFAPDLDLLYGDKNSEIVVAATTNVVFGFFCFEMVLQSFAKPQYFPRWPLFIDFISLVSIVPDTYFFKVAMSNPDVLVSGRLSSFESFFKLATRSTRAFRLNRLFRIVKIVALVPRVTNLFVRNKRNVDAQVDKMLAKKLERVFAVLDEDLDNKIEYESLQLCLSRMKKGKGMQDRVSQTTMLAAPSSTFMNIGASGGVSVRSLKTHMSLRTPTSRGHHRVVTSAATSSTLGEKAATPMSGSPTDSREASSQLVWQKAETDSRGQDSITRAAPPVRSSVTSNLVSEDSVTLDVFKGKIMEDEWVYQKLRAACEAELRNSHSVGNMASKHAEDVGMKVALAVLVMLLAVNLLSPTQVDLSALQGLRYLDHQRPKKLPMCRNDAFVGLCAPGGWAAVRRAARTRFPRRSGAAKVVRKMADGSMNATGTFLKACFVPEPTTIGRVSLGLK
ncbi:unnamed protein product [Prorocentrum cordatum]|uniref:EF-hand domain-containing protein n=1 Tax=Prorocentrum cordatum TaxID=2364126 RepID=A0ABN9XLV2_9DINO|nr:unnamed protein product [Polarella glacialis]